MWEFEFKFDLFTDDFLFLEKFRVTRSSTWRHEISLDDLWHFVHILDSVRIFVSWSHKTAHNVWFLPLQINFMLFFNIFQPRNKCLKLVSEWIKLIQLLFFFVSIFNHFYFWFSDFTSTDLDMWTTTAHQIK